MICYTSFFGILKLIFHALRCLFKNIVKMQYRIPFTILVMISFILMNAEAQDSIAKPDSISINNKLLYKVVAFESAYYASSMIILQNSWYQDRKVVPFHFYNDNKGYLQVDKFGHAFGAYVESYIGYHCLRNIGITKTKALLFGGSLGLILQTPIEIMDGIHEGWGFSWGDMAANAFGTSLFLGQEILFDDQIVKYKFSYRESEYSHHANGYLGETSLNRLLKDYNGHTYWLSLNVNRIIQNNHIPAWLNIAVGYSANGMYGEYENISGYKGVAIPTTMRYRQYLLSLDIDWTKIKTRSKFLNIVFKGMTFIKLPFPALEYNSIGKFKGYWVYY